MGLLFCCGEYCKGVTVYAEMTYTFLGQNWANIKTKGTFQKSELIPRLVILLTALEITYNNFEILLVVFMPNITTNHAITYTNYIILLEM